MADLFQTKRELTAVAKMEKQNGGGTNDGGYVWV